MNVMDQLRPKLDSLRKVALPAGVLGLIVCGIGAVVDPTQFFRSWLFAFLFWLAPTLGSLAWLMVHHVVGGGWGFVIRRPLEAATRVLPLMLVFFVPLLFGMNALYPWANPENVRGDEVLESKALYLNVPGFIIRAAIYFAIWIGLAYYFNKKSREQDETGDAMITHRATLMAPPGLILYVLTMTFAAVDWVMSMNP
ncbi:MAG TPA: hypothetical protein VF719_03150, partial [Abditibacteriaceae bacterium]